MEAKNSKKINYLAYLNISLGFISFLTGLIPLLIFISTIGYALTRLSFWDSYVFTALYGFYYDVMRNHHPVFFVSTLIFILLGIFTFPTGLVSSMYINDKLLRGIAFLGNTLGTLGIVGNLIGLVLTIIPTS
jgi:hypothetical protein